MKDITKKRHEEIVRNLLIFVGSANDLRQVE